MLVSGPLDGVVCRRRASAPTDVRNDNHVVGRYRGDSPRATPEPAAPCFVANLPGSLAVKWLTRVLAVVGVLALLVGGLVVSRNAGFLSPFGIESRSRDSQVIQAVERTEEVALVGLNIQGITSEKRSSTIFGRSVPGTSETVYVQYEFTAKLGIDGAKVDVSRDGADGYSVSVPAFTFIGSGQPKFEEAVTDGGVLSFVTADVDRFELVNKILGDGQQAEYVAKNREALEEQTKAFYGRLITSIDPGADVAYTFATDS